MKKSTFVLCVFVIVVLSIALVVLFYLEMTGWFFGAGKKSVLDFSLGQSVEVVSQGTGATAISLDYEGSFISGQLLPQEIGVKNVGDEQIYLRAKAFLQSDLSQTFDVTLQTTTNWTLADDGYYYFNSEVSSGASVGVCSYISLDEQLSSGERYIFTLIVESLSAQLDVQTIWGEGANLID